MTSPRNPLRIRNNMITAKYFKESEFKACTPSCSLQNMDQKFMQSLDALRSVAGIPLVLNCAYRSVEWDKAKGRSGNSAHTRGKAVDIRCTTTLNRMKIVKAALAIGIRRIGIGKNFIHVDTDTSLPQDVIFHYYE